MFSQIISLGAGAGAAVTFGYCCEITGTCAAETWARRVLNVTNPVAEARFDAMLSLISVMNVATFIDTPRLALAACKVALREASMLAFAAFNVAALDCLDSAAIVSALSSEPWDFSSVPESAVLSLLSPLWAVSAGLASLSCAVALALLAPPMPKNTVLLVCEGDATAAAAVTCSGEDAWMPSAESSVLVVEIEPAKEVSVVVRCSAYCAGLLGAPCVPSAVSVGDAALFVLLCVGDISRTSLSSVAASAVFCRAATSAHTRDSWSERNSILSACPSSS